MKMTVLEEFKAQFELRRIELQKEEFVAAKNANYNTQRTLIGQQLGITDAIRLVERKIK